MTIIYRTPGAWGPGQGANLTPAQVDGNFYDLVQQVAAIVADLPDGVLIDSADPVEITAAAFRFNFTDATQSAWIALPVATFTPAGEWQNSTPYFRNNVITARKFGTYLVLQDHTTPAPPAPFDPDAVNGSAQPLYSLIAPYLDVFYDIAISVPGVMQRAAGELVAQVPVVRPFTVAAGAANAFAYLDVALAGATDVVISIEHNRTEIGTITFPDGVEDTGGGVDGTIAWTADVAFVNGDIIGFRIVQSNDAAAASLAIGIPGVRDDV